MLESRSASTDCEADRTDNRNHPGPWRSIQAQILAAPTDEQAWLALAEALWQADRYHEALNCRLKAFALVPDRVTAEAYWLTGNGFAEIGQADQAIACYRQAIDRDPGLGEVWVNWGNLLLFQDEPAAARAIAARAIVEAALAAGHDRVELYLILAETYRCVGDLAAAIPAYRAALDRDPPDRFALCSTLFNCYFATLELDKAIAMGEAAIALKPDCADTHYNLSFAYLLAGDYPRGFAAYEWRWAAGRRFHKLTVPPWDGKTSLLGQTILIWADQGYGDALQFVRFLPELARQNCQIILCCLPALVPLLSALPSVAATYGFGERLPDFDCHFPLMSLPAALGTTLDQLPADVPYLVVPPPLPDLAQAIADRIDPNVLNLGIVWASGYHAWAVESPQLKPEGKFDFYETKTAGLDLFLDYLDRPGLRLHSLQVGRDGGDLEAIAPPNAPGPIDWRDCINSFADTAAIVQHLDLIITVDTAVAHLAGALARPTWVLLCHPPEWRWFCDRSDSPWYPTMRLFRQSPDQPGNWRIPFQKIQRDLQRAIDQKLSQTQAQTKAQPSSKEWV